MLTLRTQVGELDSMPHLFSPGHSADKVNGYAASQGVLWCTAPAARSVNCFASHIDSWIGKIARNFHTPTNQHASTPLPEISAEIFLPRS
jgi:hypothetical protein